MAKNTVDNLSRYLISEKDYSLVAQEKNGEIFLFGDDYDPEFDYPIMVIPELETLAKNFDRVLVRSDGMDFSVYCIHDATKGNKQISLTPKEIKSVGQDCTIYTGKVGTTKMLVQLYIVEICNTQNPGTENLKSYKNFSYFARKKTTIGVFSLNEETKGIKWYGSTAFVGTFMFKKFLKYGDDIVISNKPKSQVEIKRAIPFVALGLILSFIIAFIIELFASNSFLDPNNMTLVKMGANHFDLIKDGDYFRLLSSAFLHGGYMHLFFNCIAMFLSGIYLERYLGHRWFLSIFVFSAIGGSLVSIMTQENILSVGASGGILGLIAASFLISNKLPHGKEKSDIQMNTVYMLIASFVPSFTSSMNIDYATHAGGAIVGFFMALVLYVTWPKDSPHPKLSLTSSFAAIASVFLIILSFVQTLSAYEQILIEEEYLQNQEQSVTDVAREYTEGQPYANAPESYSYEFLNDALNEN